jgi:hypothetical protein
MVSKKNENSVGSGDSEKDVKQKTPSKSETKQNPKKDAKIEKNTENSQDKTQEKKKTALKKEKKDIKKEKERNKEKKPEKQKKPKETDTKLAKEEKQKEPKKKKSFMTAADQKPIHKLSEEALDPEIIKSGPKSGGQLLLFELPILFHIPFLFLYDLTSNQQLLLIQNLLFCFVLGLICIDLLNRIRFKPEKRILILIVVAILLIPYAYLLYRIINWGLIWSVKSYPVFERLFT